MRIPTTINMKADTRDAIVSILAQKWPLSAKEVYSEAKETHGLNITYQGVHKVLNQLVDERTALNQDRKYLLNIEWIDNLRKFTDTAEKSYLKNAKVPLLEVGIGSSVEKDAFTAGREAAEKALKQVTFNKQIQLVFVFASNTYDKAYAELNKGISTITKNAPLCGCTTMGEIGNKTLQKSVVVTVICAEKENFSAECTPLEIRREHYAGTIGFGDVLNALENRAGFKKQLPDLGVIIFPGYRKNNNMQVVAPRFLEEFANRFSTPFQIAGCLAGDNWAFNETKQFCNGTVHTDTIVFTGIKTRIKVGLRRVHGLKSINNRQYKLKTKNGFVTKIAPIVNGKIAGYEPALTVYMRETGTTAKTLKDAIPLFLRELIAQNKTPTITRLSDGTHGYPTFIQDTAVRFDNAFNDGDIIQITKTTVEDIPNTTQSAIMEAAKNGGIKKIAGILLFSCASLEAVLNAHNLNEIEKIKTGGLKNTPIFGCYNAGEIGPMAVPQGSGTVVALVFGNELRG